MSLEGNLTPEYVLRGKIKNIQANIIDKSLTIDGAGADAKVVGDELAKKVGFADIIDNLTTNEADKPLSAAQGVVLKGAIDDLTESTNTGIANALSAANDAQAAADNAQASADDAQTAADNAQATANGAVESIAQEVSDREAAVGAITPASIGANYSTKAVVSLPAANWSNNTQTVTVTGVTAANDILVGCNPSDATVMEAWNKAGVYASAQTANSVTFTCTKTPTVDLSANILILEGVIG